MGSTDTAREAQAMRVLLLLTELLMSCVSAVLLLPLHGECWHALSTAIHLAVVGGYTLVGIGRLISFLIDDPIPLVIDRLYMSVAAAMFALAGGLALGAAAEGDHWNVAELGRAGLTFFVALTLVADMATSFRSVSHDDDDDDDDDTDAASTVPLVVVASNDAPPPSYAAAVALQAASQDAHQTVTNNAMSNVVAAPQT